MIVGPHDDEKRGEVSTKNACSTTAPNEPHDHSLSSLLADNGLERVILASSDVQ
jgi:hypothetical protein